MNECVATLEVLCVLRSTFRNRRGVAVLVSPFVQRPSRVRRVSDGATWNVIDYEKMHGGSFDGVRHEYVHLMLPEGTPVAEGDELEVVV